MKSIGVNFAILMGIGMIIIVSLYAVILWFIEKRRMPQKPITIDPPVKKLDFKALAKETGLVYVEIEKRERRFQDITGRYQQKIEDVSVFHWPKFDFLQDHLVLKVHPKISEGQVASSLKHVSKQLHTFGHIPKELLSLERTGIVGTYKLTYVSKKEKIALDMLGAAGLVHKDSFGELLRPDLEYNEETCDLTLKRNESVITLEKVIAALPIFNTISEEVKYKPENVKFANNTFFLKATKKAKLLLSPGESIGEKYEDYLEALKCAKTNDWVFGQSEEAEYIRLPSLSTPIIYVVGKTGSGKTVAAKSLIYNRLVLNPDTEVIFFDGKDSYDWIDFANNLSEYKLGRIDERIPLIEFQNQLEIIWKAYIDRREILKKSNSSNFEEHNNKSQDKINPLIWVIEEAPALFTQFKFGEDSAPGSISYLMRRLAREMRSTGISWVLCGQTATQDSMPVELLKQAVKVAGKLDERDAKHLGMPEATNLRHEFIVAVDSKQTKVKCFYLGNDDEIVSLTKKIAKENLEKRDYNYDLVSYTGEEKTLDEIARVAKASIFKNYKKVVYHDVVSNKDVGAVLETAQGERVALYFFSKDDLDSSIFAKQSDKTAKFHVIITSWVLNSAAMNQFKKERKKGDWPAGATIASFSRFSKLISQSFETGEDVAEAEWFAELREQIAAIEDGEAEAETEIADFGSSTSVDYSFTAALAEIGEVTVKEYDRISNLLGRTNQQKTKKGRQMEAFVAKYFCATGIPLENIYAGDKLKNSGIINSQLFGDGGADVVIKHNNKEVTLIQVKNWVTAIPSEEITKTLMAKNYAEESGHTVKESLFVTTSWFTDDAELALKASKTTGWNGQLFRSKVQAIQNKPGRPPKTKEETTSTSFADPDVNLVADVLADDFSVKKGSKTSFDFNKKVIQIAESEDKQSMLVGLLLIVSDLYPTKKQIEYKLLLESDEFTSYEKYIFELLSRREQLGFIRENFAPLLKTDLTKSLKDNFKEFKNSVSEFYLNIGGQNELSEV